MLRVRSHTAGRTTILICRVTMRNVAPVVRRAVGALRMLTKNDDCGFVIDVATGL